LYPIITVSHQKLKLRNDKLIYYSGYGDSFSVHPYDISNLQLLRVAEHLVLLFDLEEEKIEIGKSLEDPDKEWLYNRLQEWLRLKRT